MKTIRGVKPAKAGHGSGWQIVVSDPIQKRQRRFNYDTKEEAIAKKGEIKMKIKALQQGALTLPPNVIDAVLWFAKGGKNGCSKDAVEPAETALISDTIDTFLDVQRNRIGLPGNKGISVERYGDYKFQLGKFKDYCISNKLKTVKLALSAQNLDEYRDHCEDNTDSAYTLQHGVYPVKCLVSWAWEMHRINDLPRNLATFQKVTFPDPVALVFDPGEITLLFHEANPRMKLYILLALNAGYTQKEIADLKHKSVDWDKGMIDEIRGKIKKKASVPRRVKLWPSTLASLKKHASEPSNKLVLLTDKGNPLVLSELKDESTKVSKNDCIQRAFLRLKNQLKIKNRSFKNFRKTGADLIKNKYVGAKTKTNTELFNYYLAHKPPKMEMHYDPGDWAEVHQATDWLGKHLSLFEAGILEGSG